MNNSIDNNKPLKNPAEQKVEEYIERIKAGESKEKILDGLPPSFVAGIEAGLNKSEESLEHTATVDPEIPPQYSGLDADTVEFLWTIPEYVDPEKTKEEKMKKETALKALREKENQEKDKQRQALVDNVKIEEVRKDLGIGSDENLSEKQADLKSFEEEASAENHLISGLVKYVSKGRRQAVVDLYQELLADVSNDTSRKHLAAGLFQDIYNKYRIAEYPGDPKEEETWEKSLKNHSEKIEVNNKNSEWMYRGNFSKTGEETVTRGSFNVRVTPELIDALDDMISSGKIRANYKFGQPGTTASPTERHDSISIYFLEKPSNEAMAELESIIKPYVRGDNLLGKKVADGFFMSEIGSIETKHIDKLVENLKAMDPAFAEAVRGYTLPKQGNSLKMSEAQYYSIKDVAKAFGYEISYDKEKGFEIKQNN